MNLFDPEDEGGLQFCSILLHSILFDWLYSIASMYCVLFSCIVLYCIVLYSINLFDAEDEGGLLAHGHRRDSLVPSLAHQRPAVA